MLKKKRYAFILALALSLIAIPAFVFADDGDVSAPDNTAVTAEVGSAETPAAPSEEQAVVPEEPSAQAADPEIPAVEPESPAADPETPAADPETPAADSETPAVEPETPVADPETPAADPETPAADPETPAADPEAPAVEPETPAEPEVPQEPAKPVKTGWVKENGKLYYYKKDGTLFSGKGWQTIGGAKYYCLGEGVFATSPTKIATKVTVSTKVKYKVKVKVKKKGKKKYKYKTKYKTVKKVVTQYPLYMFGADGKLITKTGVFTSGSKEYYGSGGGILKTGWVASGDNAMYFDSATGAMAKGTTVGYLKIPASGRLGKAYALGIKKLNSTGWTLKTAYKNSYKLKYKERSFRRKTSEEYAIRGFTKGNGNCYVMAATFYIQAKLLGYDVHQVKGKVAHIYPHSWTVIKHGKKDWVYDPNFKNETGRNGWKIYYGKKGTWKYTNYSKMN